MVAFIDHIIGVGDAVLGAKRVKREPHVAAGVLHQLAHDGEIPFVRTDDHAAAKEVEDRALRCIGFSLTIKHGNPFTVIIS